MRLCGLRSCNPFDTEVPIGPLASGQFGGSAALDLVAGGRDTPRIYLYIGRGDGSFGAPSSEVQIAGAVGGLADVAVADLDDDGALDAVTTNPGSRLVGVVKGDGLGDLSAGPTLTLGSVPGRLLLADVTGDGHPDAIVATDTGVVVLRGIGDGSFELSTTIATGTPVADLGLADLDGDGHADLIVALPGLNEIQVDRGDGAGNFAFSSSVTLASPTALAVGDFTGDGHVDVAVATATDAKVVLLAGTGSGLSAPTVLAMNLPATRLVATDTDGDGNEDLIALDASSGVAMIAHGDGTGGIEGQPMLAVVAGGATPGIAVGDFDGTGLPDIALSLPDSQQVIVALSPPECTGDCNVDQVVTINELITGVNIALGTEPVAQCHRADSGHDGAVSIDELITAVGFSLNGCP